MTIFPSARRISAVACGSATKHSVPNINKLVDIHLVALRFRSRRILLDLLVVCRSALDDLLFKPPVVRLDLPRIQLLLLELPVRVVAFHESEKSCQHGREPLAIPHDDGDNSQHDDHHDNQHDRIFAREFPEARLPILAHTPTSRRSLFRRLIQPCRNTPCPGSRATRPRKNASRTSSCCLVKDVTSMSPIARSESGPIIPSTTILWTDRSLTALCSIFPAPDTPELTAASKCARHSPHGIRSAREGTQ